MLFLTNIVSVAVAGVVVLWWMGMRPVPRDRQQRARWLAAVILTVLALVPIAAILRGLEGAQEAQVAAEDLRDLFPEAEVIDVLSQATDPLRVVATVRTSAELTAGEVFEVERVLEERLARDVRLEVVIERVVRSR